MKYIQCLNIKFDSLKITFFENYQREIAFEQSQKQYLVHFLFFYKFILFLISISKKIYYLCKYNQIPKKAI